MGSLHAQSKTSSAPAAKNEISAPAADTAANEASLLTALLPLVSARSLDEAFQSICATARALTGADGAALILGEKNQCFYIAEDAMAPLWKGQHFDETRCISGWTMEHREPAVVSDIRHDSRVPLDFYRNTFVRSLAIVPACVDVPIGAIGVYWARIHSLDPALLAQLQTLAGLAAVLIENMKRHNVLEERLHQAETELQATQQKLAAEIHLRGQHEARLQLLEQTDTLTGLNNRLGFLSRAQQLFKMINRVSVQAWLIYIDLDGLMQINRSFGYEAGDRMLKDAARVLRENFRDSDILARIRDDEFIAFVVSASDPLVEIKTRLTRSIDHLNRRETGKPPLVVTIGAVRCDPRGNTPLEDLIHQADAAMYLVKRKKRLKIVEPH